MPMAGKKGFTLIELLIVVAIIAILAAIAVPNFLEAQTRAKISSVMAGMKTVATAVEMYRVDNNRWPYGQSYLFLQYADGTSLGDGWQLTTPIQYLTTMPRDFVNSGKKLYANAPPISWVSFGFYSVITPGSVFDPITAGAPTYKKWWAAMTPHGPDVRVEWFFESAGPDQAWWNTQRYPELVYDPTNGTVSEGDIFYISNYGFLGGQRGR